MSKFAANEQACTNYGGVIRVLVRGRSKDRGYNFIDLVRTGAPLTVLMWASLSTIQAVHCGR